MSDDVKYCVEKIEDGVRYSYPNGEYSGNDVFTVLRMMENTLNILAESNELLINEINNYKNKSTTKTFNQTSNERFQVFHLRDMCSCDIQDTYEEIPTFYNDLGDISSVKPLCDLMNHLNNSYEIVSDEFTSYQNKVIDILDKCKEKSRSNPDNQLMLKTIYNRLGIEWG